MNQGLIPVGSYRSDEFFNYFGDAKPEELIETIRIMKADMIKQIECKGNIIPLIWEIQNEDLHDLYIRCYGTYMPNIYYNYAPYIRALERLDGVERPIVIDNSNMATMSALTPLPEDARIYTLQAHFNDAIINQIIPYFHKNTVLVDGTLYHHKHRLLATQMKPGFVSLLKNADASFRKMRRAINGFSLRDLIYLFKIPKIDYLILRGFESNPATIYGNIETLKEYKVRGEFSVMFHQEVPIMVTFMETNGFSCEPVQDIIYFTPKEE